MPANISLDFIDVFEKQAIFRYTCDKNEVTHLAGKYFIVFISVFEKQAGSFSQKIFFSIQNKFKDINILGPVPAIIFKKNNRFRYRILLKLVKNYSRQNEIKTLSTRNKFFHE